MTKNVAQTWHNYRPYQTPIQCPATGLVFKSPEHLFNAKKSLKLSDQRHVAAAGSSGEAKARGRRVKLREEWDERIKEDVMFYALMKRAETEPEFLKALLAATDDELVEWNRHHDNEWGLCLCQGCYGKKRSKHLLQKTLIRVRNVLSFVDDSEPEQQQLSLS
ncbi:MAG TPA: NADAR family protein [Leptolyngbyaceae cyanobacterium]